MDRSLQNIMEINHIFNCVGLVFTNIININNVFIIEI